jgi:gluconolactonase
MSKTTQGTSNDAGAGAGMEKSRRSFLAAALGGAALAPALMAQQKVSPVATPRDWTGAVPIMYPDPDLVALDPRFQKYIIFNSPIRRNYLGTSWAEGPAWNGVGRYLVWSDIPANVQMSWHEEDGHVSVFRNPSNYSNGNTFDNEGRQLSCEHAGRRVVRYEYNGTQTIIADHYQGKKLNSPNDIVVHPDGGIWFTDPTYGIQGNYEAFKATSELKQAVYRVDPKTGQIEKVTDDAEQPNGICFSPDYKKIYIADTGAPLTTRVYDVDGKTLKNGKEFIHLDVPGTGEKVGVDGLRCDTDGNLWCGVKPGVQIVTSAGERIGMIRLPEQCANVTFGGTKRNRLFMIASQSLYSVVVQTQGAHFC